MIGTLLLPFASFATGYYIVFKGSEYEITTENSITLTNDDFTQKETSIDIVAIKDGYLPNKQTVEFTFEERIETPYFGYNMGFVSENLYELTFKGSENAIGYYDKMLEVNNRNIVAISMF